MEPLLELETRAGSGLMREYSVLLQGLTPHYIASRHSLVQGSIEGAIK